MQGNKQLFNFDIVFTLPKQISSFLDHQEVDLRM